MNQLKPESIEITIANARKPIALSNYSYPFNFLDDRIFEMLTYSVFKRRISTKDPSLESKYDDIQLMQGIGDKGLDCILTKKQKIVAAIQCKKYSSNLSDSIILSELVKFGIQFFLDKPRFTSVNRFKYFIATSTGYTGKAIQLLELMHDKSFLKYYNFKQVATKLINKFSEFRNITFHDIEFEVPEILSKFKYELIRPADLNLWINNYPEIIQTFFEVKNVTDNTLLEKKGSEIITKLDEILSPKENDNILAFIAKYRTASIEKLNIVNFIGFDLHRYRQKPTDITLTELFVQPAFHQRIFNKNEKIQNIIDKDLKIANVLKSEKNIVLLGDPGAGKSLLIKFIMVQILSKNSQSIGLRQFADYVPFRIELRKYNEVRENKTIIQHLSDIITREYQTPINPDTLNQLILNSDTLLFFDGLDEIFNVTHKNKIKESIELFSASYKKSKCIVTSRFIGYHDTNFNSNKFDEFAIQRFSQKQIEELINKFYETQVINLEKRKIAVASCISQIEKDVDEELKSNPLIMTLILILSSNNIIIPDSKLEIYEACTKTLVDSIDTKEKELQFEMPVKNKRLTFANLAYWQYETLSKNQIVSYDKAVKTIADMLIDKKEVKEFTEAEEKAKKFLEYAEKRSIYFEDNFTHKTFLEYYTADYLYINYFTKASDAARKKVISLITLFLPKSFWYIVFELLLTRIDKEQADSELLDEIFTKQLDSPSLNVFYFLISNLPKFVNVGDDVKKKILKKTILLCIRGEKMTELRGRSPFDENSLITKFSQLQMDNNIFQILQGVFNEFEEDGLGEKDLIEFYIFYFEVASLNNRYNLKKYLTISNGNQLKELAYKDLHLFCHAIIPKSAIHDSISINVLLEQIEHFGTRSLFKDLPFRHRENVRRIDTFGIYLINVIERQNYEGFYAGYNKLLENGVKHENVIEHVKSSIIYYFHREDAFLKVLKFYLKSVDKKTDEIILSVVRSRHEMKNAYDKFRATNNDEKLKNIDKIFNKR